MPSDPTVPDPSRATGAHARFLAALRTAIEQRTLVRLVLAGPRGSEPDLQRVLLRPLELKGRAHLSLTYQYRTRDVTKNLPVTEGVAEVAALLAARFGNAHLHGHDGSELQLAISRKGKATLRRGQAAAVPAAGARCTATAEGGHDRARQRLIDVRSPWLQALGVTDAQARVIPAMARKWRQINKFVEVLGHALASEPALAEPLAGRPLEVLDFGAGKGYLTFAVHDHLQHTLGRPVRVTGVDLKADMVELGNQTARRLGLQQQDRGLHFELGDVRSYAPRPVDVMIALHACDTATDHAMHMGVRAGAAIIMCSPCCHKQLRPQLRSPLLLLPLLRHGIHLGQEAEMLTDGLRALLLEAEGYDTQVFEFTSLEHTSKNKMILATRRARPKPAEPVREQIREIKAFYGVQEQCLETLLAADGGRSGA